jgi:hypothetical protein
MNESTGKARLFLQQYEKRKTKLNWPMRVQNLGYKMLIIKAKRVPGAPAYAVVTLRTLGLHIRSYPHGYSRRGTQHGLVKNILCSSNLSRLFLPNE